MPDDPIPKGKYIGVELDAPPRPERDHFYRCKWCGALVDYRDLGQVFAHEGEHSEPPVMMQTGDRIRGH